MRISRFRQLSSVAVAGLAAFAMLSSGVAASAVQPAADDLPTISDCTPENTVYVTPENKAGWVFTNISDQDFGAAGITLNTTGAKQSGLVPTDIRQDNACLPTYEYAGTGVQPGFNYVQLANPFATLVYEPTAPGYGKNWWSSKDLGVGAGMGYTSFAPLEAYFEAGMLTSVKQAGFTLGSGVTGEGVLKSISIGDTKYVFKDKAPLPAAVECVASKTVEVTPAKLEGWNFDETTATGSYTFTKDGLKIETTGGKVAGLAPANLDAGNFCLPTMEYAGEGSHPGFNYRQWADEDAGRIYAGLVYEPTYNGDNWWSNKDLGVGAGNGYSSYAPLSRFFDAGKITQIGGAGFALGTLGEGQSASGVLKSITFGDTKYVFKDKASLPAAVECVASKTVEVTPAKLEGWNFDETTATGSYTFTKDGLKIETTGGKVAGLAPANLDAGNFCLPTMEYAGEGSHPGFNYRQWADEDAGRIYAGLVYEPTYYGDNWWSNKDLGVGAGMGYNSYAPLSRFFDAGKITQIGGAGFALGTLGEGQSASGVLKSITFGDTKYVFKDKASLPAAVECVASKTVEVTAAKLEGWNFDETTATGSYTFTKDGLKIETTGGKVAGLAPANLDAGNFCLPTMEYAGEGPRPGFNYRQWADEDAGRIYAGLVYEPTYNGDNWWSNKDLGVGAGIGYNSYAPLSRFFDAGKITQIGGAGFALGTLGEGQSASGVLKSITFGDTKYVFTLAPVVPPVDPSAKVSKTNVKAGDTVTVTGSSFAPGESVELWLGVKPAVSLGKFKADADGKVSAQVKLPTGLAKGKYTIELKGASSGSATVSVTVETVKVDPPKPPVVEPAVCAEPRKVAVFADAPLSHKFYKAIDWMECMKYSTGWKQPAGKPLYKPADNLQRQAMAAFIFRMEADKNYQAPKVSPFADVQPGDKFYREIAWMWDQKLSTGYQEAGGKPTYRPTDSLSREAMAAFIYRLEASKDAKVKAYQAPKASMLADMKPGAKFYKEISWMYDTKLSTGNKVGNTKEYWPKADLSRQAMAAFIYRLVTDYRAKK